MCFRKNHELGRLHAVRTVWHPVAVRREPGERACDNGGAAWYDRCKEVRAWHGDAASGTDAECRRETHGDDLPNDREERKWGTGEPSSRGHSL